MKLTGRVVQTSTAQQVRAQHVVQLGQAFNLNVAVAVINNWVPLVPPVPFPADTTARLDVLAYSLLDPITARADLRGYSVVAYLYGH
jgi:hypothetical protein